MPTGLRKERWEITGLLLVAALVVCPTIILAWIAVASLGSAQASFEKQLRDAYSKTAQGIIAQSVDEIGSKLAGVERAADDFRSARTPEKRLAVAEAAPFVTGVVMLDSRWREIYPKEAIPVIYRQSDAKAIEALAAAEQTEAAGGPAAAIPLYEALAENEDAGGRIGARSLAGCARCLAAAGRTDEALAAYAELAGAPASPGDLSLPLLARFRTWQLSPSDESASALFDACLSGAFDAPSGQVRYYLESLGEPADARSRQTVGRLQSLLRSYESDRALSRDAKYLVTPGLFTGEAANWTWRRSELAGRRYLWGGRVLPAADGAETETIELVFLEPQEVAATVVTPIAADRFQGDGVRFELAADVLQGKAFEGPPGTETIAAETFPKPFDFWTLEVISRGPGLEEIAGSRVRLMTWAIFLAASAGVVGIAAVFVWARRRMNLARLQTDFVANVTHELKTPLTAIQSLAETIQLGRLTAPEKEPEFIAAIVQETQRLSRLINNVLDFSRLEKGGPRLRLEETDLNVLVQDAVAGFKAALDADEGDSVDVSVPQEPVVAGVDRDSVTRAIFNLLDNAHKYSNPPRSIRVKVAVRDGQAVVSVSDNGIGLMAREMRSVFRKFYRVDTSLSARTQGAGLGLSLVKAYIEAHGGAVEVESKPGEGSTFSIVLPLRNAGETT